MSKYSVYIVDKHNIGGTIYIYADDRLSAFTKADKYVWNYNLHPAAILEVKEVEYNAKGSNPYVDCSHEYFAKLIAKIARCETELIILSDDNIKIVRFLIDNIRRLNQYNQEAMILGERRNKRQYVSSIDDYVSVETEHIDYPFSRDDLNEIMMNIRDACLELQLMYENALYADKIMEAADELYVKYAAKVVYNYRRI